jgi:hypothetical protein
MGRLLGFPRERRADEHITMISGYQKDFVSGRAAAGGAQIASGRDVASGGGFGHRVGRRRRLS